MFANRLTSLRLFPLLLVISLAAFVLSCGEEPSDEVRQVVDADTPPPTLEDLASTTSVAPTATQALTATVHPTATETPYWAKKIIPGTAMDLYPPLNDRTDYELRNTQQWLNGGPTTIKELRESGRIVLIDFWTYT